MSLPVALQLYSVRNRMKEDFAGTLKAVRAVGYDGVEFAGLFGKDPKEVRAICLENGLTPISAHIPLAEMKKDPDAVFSAYREVGCRYAAIPYLSEDLRPSTIEGVRETANLFASLGKKALEYGIALMYHNHDFEFRPIEGKFMLDLLYEEAPEEYLKTQIDTCWVKVAGQDPSDYLLKYAGREPLVHLKDFYMKGKLEGHPYALLGQDENPDTREKGVFEFRAVGEGMQDFASILDASVKAGAEWLVVELDSPAPGMEELFCAEKSFINLKKWNR